MIILKQFFIHTANKITIQRKISKKTLGFLMIYNLQQKMR